MLVSTKIAENAICFSLDTQVFCMEWCSDDSILALGHSKGVTLLQRHYNEDVNSAYSSPLQREWGVLIVSTINMDQAVLKLRFKGLELLACHPDHTVSVLDLRDANMTKLTKLSGGHSAYIQSIDVSADGLYASTGFDREVLVWRAPDQLPQMIRLKSVGRIVRFWNTNSSLLLVVEGDDRIHIYDLQGAAYDEKNGTQNPDLLVTIFVGKKIQDIATVNDDILVVGSDWWKKFSIQNLRGGAGYTFANESGELQNLNALSSFSKDGMFLGSAAASGAEILFFSQGTTAKKTCWTKM